jgi:hypothetical protein
MPQFTAVVRDAHGACFVATAHSQGELEAQVVEYIRERCDYVLWPRVAANVHALIARGTKDSAIAAYFANVGQRWDPEWLELVDGDVLRADFAALRPMSHAGCPEEVQPPDAAGLGRRGQLAGAEIEPPGTSRRA